jgi:hypothetical protein
MDQPQKTIRLNFKSYMQLINNSVGAHLFRNFYVKTDEKGEFDALDNGNYSCAFFVSSILVIFKKLCSFHGTVEATVKDLNESGWIEVSEPQPGDILVWEAILLPNGLREHIGFSLGNSRAISTTIKKKTPVEHDEHYGKTNRKITHIYRMPNWE